MINGSNLSFSFRLLNDDDTPAKHSDFLDVIVYVYVYVDKIVKLSKSDKYIRLVPVDDYYLRADLDPAQTRSLGSGVPKFSIHAVIPAQDYANGKMVLKGKGKLLEDELEFDPITDEQ